MNISSTVFDADQGIHCVRIKGDVYPADIQQITSTLNTILDAKAKHLVFIFEECTWVTSYFIRVLFSFSFFILRTGGNFLVVLKNEDLLGQLRQFSLDDILDICTDEPEAFQRVHLDPDTTKVNIHVKGTILARIEESIRAEDLRIKAGEKIGPPGEDHQDTDTLMMAAGHDDSGETLVQQDLDTFNATLEMSLTEMGLYDPEEESPLTAELMVGQGSEIDTHDNPVQFLNVDGLSLDKDSDFERQIKEESERHEADRMDLPTIRETRPSHISSIMLPFRPEPSVAPDEVPTGYSMVNPGIPFWSLISNLPEGSGPNSIRRLIDACQRAIDRGHEVIVWVDSHTLAMGLSGWLMKLIVNRCITGLVVGLSAALKDFDATFGIDNAERKREVINGDFGIAAETVAQVNEKLGQETDLGDVFGQLIMENSGTFKERSIIYHAKRSKIWISVSGSDRNPATDMINTDNADQAVNKIVNLIADHNEPVVIFPCNHPGTFNGYIDMVHIVSHKGLSSDLLTTGYCSRGPVKGFSDVMVAGGYDTMHIDGDPQVLFPLLAESILDRKNR